MTRFYVLSMTAAGTASQEFPSERARAEYLRQRDDRFDDFYCLDIEGELKSVYAATTGAGVDLREYPA
ncbi:hypothetical protein VLK31_20795 [Variovorax sp. H27-G14]|uniref:hypothetical protein n=1 Tax=Variovorax sp. H27-G14 TaxID=3111914 RepID=UPI0038FC12CD